MLLTLEYYVEINCNHSYWSHYISSIRWQNKMQYFTHETFITKIYGNVFCPYSHRCFYFFSSLAVDNRGDFLSKTAPSREWVAKWECLGTKIACCPLHQISYRLTLKVWTRCSSFLQPTIKNTLLWFNILMKIALKFVPHSSVVDKTTLDHVAVCCLTGHKPLHEPVMT